jgi:hypothetical protein
MRTQLESILAVLDEGLLLYRRNFVGFLVIAAVVLVPSTIGIGIAGAALANQQGSFILLAVGLWIITGLPLAVYVLGGLSRAAVAAQRGEPVRLRSALAIPPLRALGMGLYMVLFYILANMVVSTLLLCVLCPLYLGGTMLLAGVISAGGVGSGNEGMTVAVALLAIAGTLIFYMVALVLGSSTYAGLAYGLQPFAQEELNFGHGVQRSFELLGYRLWGNLLAFVVTSAVFGATTLVVTVAVGVLVPLPVVLLLGSESLVAQGIGVAIWTAAGMFTLPLLPIWMALWYRRNVGLRDGADLERRIVAELGTGG